MELTRSDKEYLELYEDNKKRLEKRRTTNSMSEIVFVKRGSRVGVPKRIYESQTPYIFLQYYRLVSKWGASQLDISKITLEIILYLYPIGIFSKFDFDTMCKTIDLYSHNKLKLLTRKGLIKVWRKGGQSEVGLKRKNLYCLTSKSTDICSKMHSVMAGEDELPKYFMEELSKSRKSVDKYYLNIMKRMQERAG